MKLLIRTFLIILIILSSSSIVYSAAKTFGDTNIRDVPCIGFRVNGVEYEKDSDWMDWKFEQGGFKEMLETNPQAFERANLCLMRKIKWRNYYVDETLAPASREQAQDPNWENYKWNSNDEIGKMLNHELVTSGKLKIFIGFASSASEQAYTIPLWFLENEEYVYSSTNNYARWDYQEVVDHVADFKIAFVKKYGTEPNLAGLQFGEYYRGPYQEAPGFSYTGYLQGKRDLWRQVSEAMPLYEDGTRMALYQVNPILKGGVTLDDMINYGIGISRSDSPMFGEECGRNGDPKCRENSVAHSLQEMEGILPNMIMGDARYSFSNHRITWTGYPNPFGHQNGYSAVASPQEMMWFYSSKGLTPLNSFFLNIDNGAGPFTVENYVGAVSKFGPGGSLAEEWGMIPAHFDEDSVQYDSYWTSDSFDGSSNSQDDSSEICYKIKPGVTIPSGFGASYDFENEDVFFKGQCSINSINLNVGSSDITYVYENGYYWDEEFNDWIAFKLNGENVGTSPWFSSNGFKTLNDIDMGKSNYVLAYACKWTGSEWKCGCQDRACNNPAWNLQIYGGN